MAPGNSTEPDADSPGNPVKEYVTENPISATLLVVAMIGGATASYFVFEGSLSAPRRILGGAISGFGCWLLVMVGRLIGE